MKKYLLLILFFNGINIFSQHSLNGKITDINNNVISGTEIYLPQLHKGTVSDFDGNYHFNNLPNGTYKITLLNIGYKTIEDTIEIIKNKIKNYTLEETAFEIDEVIISTPFNKLQSHNVMKVEGIKLDDNKVTNLTDKLTKIAGISTIGTGNGIGKPVIRGLSGNRVLVYNQGVKFENFQSGEKHGLGINENGISNVEVIKGPASLLYGSDALGGVIYLVPEKFELEGKTSASLSSNFQSNSLGFNSSIGTKTSTDNFKFISRVSYNTQSDYITANNVIVTNSRFNNRDFKAGFGFDKEKIIMDVRYNYNLAYNGITHGINSQNRSKKIHGLYQKLTNHVLSVKNNFFIRNITLKTNLGFTHHNRNLFENDVKTIDMSLNTLNYDVKGHLQNMGKIETIVGFQGMYQTNTNNSEHIFLPDAQIVDFGVFATSNYDFNNNTIQLGLRFDNRNIKTEEHGVEGQQNYFKPLHKNLNNITGALGWKTNLSKKIISRINIALGFRAPNLSELTSHGFHEGRYEFGNNDLKNEQNIQLDVNLEYSNKFVEFFTNGFYNKINNYIYLSPSNQTIDGFDVYTFNQNNSSLYGGEIGLHYHPEKYKFVHLKTSGELVIGLNDNGNFLPRIPGVTFKNNIKFDFKINEKFINNYFSVNNKTVLKQNNISEFETIGQGYSLFGIGLGTNYQLKNNDLNFYIVIDNLLNKEYIDHLSVLKEDNIANPGRNISLGINFKF